MCEKDNCEQKPKAFEPVDVCAVKFGAYNYLVRQISETMIVHFKEKEDCQGRKFWENVGDLSRPNAEFLIAVFKAIGEKKVP